MMKRIIAVIVATAVAAVLFCGCSPDNNQKGSGDKLSIVTTIFPSYDFARQIGGDKADVTMLLKPGMESHSYDPTPQDIIKIQECDLFIYVGGESDHWVNDILDSDKEKPKKVIALMECVDTVTEDTVEGMTEEEHEEKDSDEVEYDEHVWTSPKNAITISKKIAGTMKELSPSDASVFEKNLNSYSKELSSLDDSFRKVVDGTRNRTLVFGDRFPFRYFADEYGLNYYAAFPGCSSETEPSAATISFLIDKVKEKKIPVVFTIEFSNGKVADTICEATGAKKLEFHSCHNVTQEMFDSGVTYVSLMNGNVSKLKEALA